MALFEEIQSMLSLLDLEGFIDSNQHLELVLEAYWGPLQQNNACTVIMDQLQLPNTLQQQAHIDHISITQVEGD